MNGGILIFLLGAAAVLWIGIKGRNNIGMMGLLTALFIVGYIGLLMLGGTEHLPDYNSYDPGGSWNPFPSHWGPGPFVRSFMDTGNIGDLLTMPAMGITAVGFFMLLFSPSKESLGVLAVGIALLIASGMTDSHNAGFDAARHGPALIKFGLIAIVGFFVLRYLFKRS